jgi:hypothetical protein
MFCDAPRVSAMTGAGDRRGSVGLESVARAGAIGGAATRCASGASTCCRHVAAATGADAGCTARRCAIAMSFGSLWRAETDRAVDSGISIFSFATSAHSVGQGNVV